MDRKMTGIMAAMLAACMLIALWASVFPATGQDNSTGKYSAVYVDRFFDRNKVIDIYITLSETDFEDMLQNPTKEEYKQANVVIDGEKVNSVGFRIKGNSSLSMVARSESDRYSFKLDFDHYIKGKSLAGLTKLNLNNSMSDPSYMREYLSYSLLSETGVPVPAFCYANIYINGERAGLYLAVEGIEEPFLERYYGSNYGTLYKPEGQGSDLVYIDDSIESYSGIVLKTSRKNDADAALLDMLKALNEGTDLEKHLNIDEILRYFAVNTVLVNMDSYQGNLKHNYYLYEEDGVFSILPWDYNMSFAGYGMGGNSQSSTSLYIDQPVSGTTMDERPLIARLLEVEEYKELYHRYIEEFINGPFALDKMSAEIRRVADMIRPHLELDPTKFYTMEQFEQAIAEGSSQQYMPGNDNGSGAAVPGPQRLVQGEQNMGQPEPADGGIPFSPDDAQLSPVQNQHGPGGRQGGGDMMMQGGNAVGLMEFIRERIDDVSKQLSGELPSYGDTAQPQTGDFTRDQPGGQRERPMLQDGAQQRLPAMDRQNAPERDVFPGGAPGNMGGMEGDRNNRKADATQYMHIIAGAMLLLLAAILILFRKKTRYSLR